MYPGFNGGPFSLLQDMSATEADTWGEILMYAGESIYALAIANEDYINYEPPNYWLEYYGLLAAQRVGYTLTYFPFIWCAAVSTGDPTDIAHCADSDDFIPISSQSWSGATQNSSITGPAHTKEAGDSTILSAVLSRLCTMSPEC